nr:MAG TPA: hypothetical protein [Caudoviricetes sp.]
MSLEDIRKENVNKIYPSTHMGRGNCNSYYI